MSIVRILLYTLCNCCLHTLSHLTCRSVSKCHHEKTVNINWV